MNKTWIRTLSVLAVASFTTAALAQRATLTRPSTELPAGAPNMGNFQANGPGASGGTQVIFDNQNQFIPSLFITGVGFIDADDVGTTLDNVNGGVHESYNTSSFGNDAFNNCTDGPAYTVVTALWRDDQTPPDVHNTGTPLSPIAGTTCSFVGVPDGGVFTLDCPTGVPVNGQYWRIWTSDSDCAGWIIAGVGAPDIGFSDDFWLEDNGDAGATWNSFDFSNPAIWSSMLATDTGRETGQSACCDTATDTCTNEFAGNCQGVDQSFTADVLCNDLPDLCSDAGACCDTLTGNCRASFANLCTGIFEDFTAGGDCSSVTCEGGDNIPTVSQWGMLVLTAVLLTGLTIKFGRRRTATA